MTIATLWNDRKLTAFLTLCGASTFKIIQTSKGKRKLVALNTPQVFLNTNKELKWCQHSVPTLKKKHKQKAKNTPNKKSEYSEEGKEYLEEKGCLGFFMRGLAPVDSLNFTQCVWVRLGYTWGELG
uniref:Uncharacterized protein n=1 Tax=Rhizophagus irregularis (strain DAOM 181602 / DAOM 197198 / MUCL 43194) TaxID=747089 RepID=U9T808_RHIID